MMTVMMMVTMNGGRGGPWCEGRGGERASQSDKEEGSGLHDDGALAGGPRGVHASRAEPVLVYRGDQICSLQRGMDGWTEKGISHRDSR